jgi:hypothetical protein
VNLKRSPKHQGSANISENHSNHIIHHFGSAWQILLICLTKIVTPGDLNWHLAEGFPVNILDMQAFQVGTEFAIK